MSQGFSNVPSIIAQTSNSVVRNVHKMNRHPTEQAELAFDENDGDQSSRAVLVVYLDADSPETHTETHSRAGSRVIQIVEGVPISIGRTRESTISIDNERVSRTHALITRRGDGIYVDDVGSRNGTFVNGERISKLTALCSGDQVEVGPATCVLSIVTRIRRAHRIASIEHLEQQLAREADRGAQYGRTFALLMLRIEGPEASVDDGVSRVVAGLRTMDVIAEYSPDELVILLPELDLNAAEATAASLTQLACGPSTQATAATVRVGLALFPAHGASPDKLITRAHDALRHARTSQRNVSVARETPTSRPANAVVCDPQMERVYSLVRKVADRSMTVLIVGETGVGKEIVAEAVHHGSRRNRPFVRLNCACLPENLLESELFGHEKGSFTGADKLKIGYFEAARGGTIFLDEIGEITPSLQAKLLRVLEEHKLTRVGGIEEIPIQARVVCATNKDLAAEVEAGRFREDLYYRVSAFTIVVPPLRDRSSEIIPIAKRFLATVAEESKESLIILSPEAESALLQYSWPGNVRELRNAIERAAVLQTRRVIEMVHLPERVRSGCRPNRGAALRDRLEAMEHLSIIEALRECDGNQTQAARTLGLSRRTLIYRMEKYGIKRPPLSAVKSESKKN